MAYKFYREGGINVELRKHLFPWIYGQQDGKELSERLP